MKNIFVALVLFVALTSKSQTVAAVNANGGPAVTFESVSFDTEKNIYEFNGCVNFHDDRIHITDADRITLNSRTKKLTAYGVKRASLRNGTVIIYDTCTPDATLNYKLGSRKMVVNGECR